MAAMVWVRGKLVYRDDFTSDVETWRFLKRCKQEGRLAADEFTALIGGGSNAGRSKPETILRYDDFVRMACEETGWPEDDVRRCLALCLRDAQLTPMHIEVYINYPARSQTELAKIFGVSPGIILRMLQQVRQEWPHCLRLDTSRLQGVPRLDMMESLTAYTSDDEEYDRSDKVDVVPICGRFSDGHYEGEDDAD